MDRDRTDREPSRSDAVGMVSPGFVPPGADLDEFSDHDLLAAVAADQRLLNRLEAARQAKIAAYHARRSADHQARRAEEPHFTMTPLRETAVEVSPLIGATEGRVKAELRRTHLLQDRFPGIWHLVVEGQLDLFRASRVADAADTHLTDPTAIAAFAAQMTAWFTAHLEKKRRSLEVPDGAVDPLVTLTSRQIGNRISYLLTKLRPREADERHRRRFRDRSAGVQSTEDGMAQLVLSHDVVSLRAVDHRLTLIAKAMRRDGDKRTLDQLRTDLAVDLLLGRLTVGAQTGEFEHPETSSTGDPLDTVTAWPAQPWARPVICVTAPMQTLMGLSDEPGVLAGGEVLPAGLLRRIARDKDATWYRMLTDPARTCVELSVKGYRPTGPIVRQTVADFGTCFGPTCVVPATEAELDHRVAAPRGATSTENLGPGCKGHHQAKHSPGFGLTRHPDGDLVFSTAGGFDHLVERAEQPVGETWGDAAIWDQEFSLAEVREAVAYLAHQREGVAETAAWMRDVDQAWADYRASYPDATDEEIWGWVHDDDPGAPAPPPILRRGRTLAAQLADERATERAAQGGTRMTSVLGDMDAEDDDVRLGTS